MRAEYWLRMIACTLVLSLLSACTSEPRRPPDWSRDDAHASGSILAFNHDSTLLASGGLGGRVRLWELPEGKAGPAWRAHDGPVTGLAFVDAEGRILSAGWDRSLALWSASGVQERRLVTEAPITAIAYERTSRSLLSGHSDGAVRTWSLPDLKPISRQRLHLGKVKAVAIQNGGSLLASSGSDGQVFIWRDGEAVLSMEAPSTDTWSLAFSPDGDYLVGAGWFDIFRWSLKDNGRLVVLPTEHNGIIASISFNEEGSLAAISRQTDSAVDIMDPNNGLVLRRLQKHALCGSYVSFAPNSRYLATTSDDASVRFWNLGTTEDALSSTKVIPASPPADSQAHSP